MKNLLYFLLNNFSFTACSGGSSESNTAEETVVEPAIETVEDIQLIQLQLKKQEATEEGGDKN